MIPERIFTTPECSPTELRVIELIDGLRGELRTGVSQPHRWMGNLRRMTLARAVQGSNSIEGYDATLDDVVLAVEGEPTFDADEETQLVLAGYRDAMTYVLQMARDPRPPAIDGATVKSLHFMMLKHDLAKNPGRWRPGPIFVRRESTGEIVYEGPPAERVDDLMTSMFQQLDDDGPALVRAAMAHLNLAMIHPFSDGNGRMARCLQTLVLAREQILAPAFSSIEEYLGRNTPAYYNILKEVGQGDWRPDRDARPWLHFCLTAHYRQARTLLRRVAESESLWVACFDLAEERRLPERVVPALWDAAVGLRIRNATYRAAVEAGAGDTISELTASRDLKQLVDSDLLEPVGERRGRHYVGTPVLTDAWQAIRRDRPEREADDPFVIVGDRQLKLGEL